MLFKKKKRAVKWVLLGKHKERGWEEIATFDHKVSYSEVKDELEEMMDEYIMFRLEGKDENGKRVEMPWVKKVTPRKKHDVTEDIDRLSATLDKLSGVLEKLMKMTGSNERPSLSELLADHLYTEYLLRKYFTPVQQSRSDFHDFIMFLYALRGLAPMPMNQPTPMNMPTPPSAPSSELPPPPEEFKKEFVEKAKEVEAEISKALTEAERYIQPPCVEGEKCVEGE